MTFYEMSDADRKSLKNLTDAELKQAVKAGQSFLDAVDAEKSRRIQAEHKRLFEEREALIKREFPDKN